MATVAPAEKILEAHDLGIEGGGVCGSVYVPNGPSVETGSKLRVQGWQATAWRLWGCLWALQFPTSYVARVISRRISWEVTPESTGEALEPEQANALLSRALGRMGVEEFVRLIVLNIQVAGELWLVQESEVDGVGSWCVYSVVQPKLDEIKEKTRSAGRVVHRFHTPDPRDPEYAISSLSGVVDDAEEMIGLRALSSAQSRSHLAQAGIIVVPAEAIFEGDPFGAGLESAMTAAIQDPNSTAALAPIKVTVPKELTDKVNYLTLDRPMDERLPEKMESVVRRIAQGLDVPPELLLGVSEANHWSAWVTQEETYNGAIAPLAEVVAGLLEYVVFVALEQQVTVNPDPVELLARRPTPKDAINAFMVGAVGTEYVRKALGASEDDAPTSEDLDLLRLILNPTRSSAADESTSVTTSAPNQGVEP